jgi:hypothetical protein
MKLTLVTFETSQGVSFDSKCWKTNVKLDLSAQEKAIYDAHRELHSMSVGWGVQYFSDKGKLYSAAELVGGSNDNLFKDPIKQNEFHTSVKTGCAKLKTLLEQVARSRKEEIVDI